MRWSGGGSSADTPSPGGLRRPTHVRRRRDEAQRTRILHGEPTLRRASVRREGGCLGTDPDYEEVAELVHEVDGIVHIQRSDCQSQILRNPRAFVEAHGNAAHDNRHNSPADKRTGQLSGLHALLHDWSACADATAQRSASTRIPD